VSCSCFAEDAATGVWLIFPKGAPSIKLLSLSPSCPRCPAPPIVFAIISPKQWSDPKRSVSCVAERESESSPKSDDIVSSTVPYCMYAWH
jgi:hypothetical protein